MADLNGLTAVALVGFHEFDTAMAVPVVVPVRNWRHPLAGFIFAGSHRMPGSSPLQPPRVLSS